MEAITLRDEKVREALRGFVKVKYQADRPNQSPDHEVLDHFGVIGLPTCMIVEPRPPTGSR
jgi:thiol:disulfide interchange protein